MYDNIQLLEVFKLKKDSGVTFRERRHGDWAEIYSLYRDRVVVNRLTQRQSVNVPLMKSSVTTLMKDIDEPPMLYFENLNNDEQKEIFFNEYWNEVVLRQGGLIIKDIVDKKQAMLFGRSFKKLNIADGRFYHEVIDPQDILIDRLLDPSDLDTANFLIQSNIYRTISQLKQNPDYDQEAVKAMESYFATEEGLLEASDNMEEKVDKTKRMADMGLEDYFSPKLGETYVELNEAYMKLWDEDLKQDVIHLLVVATTAVESRILLKKKLCDVVGHTSDNFWYGHYPFTTWAIDTERTDFWSDGVGDILRTPNKILNSWMSQLVENRTLRNLGMHYYDATKEGFTPQTWEAIAWGWYGVPGKPADVVERMDIPDLSESLDEMSFVMNIAEKAVASTTTQQGAVEQTQVTLGEIQLALVNAKERVKSLSVSYNEAWKDFGRKYIKMLEASGEILDPIKVSKKGRMSNKIYTRTIKPKEWQSRLGYRVDVKMIGDKQAQDVEMIQKLRVARQDMPDNVPLQEIYKKKILQFVDLNADEMKEVMDFEKQKMETISNSAMGTELEAEAEAMAVPQEPVMQEQPVPMAQ
jgi:hypothetical protein